MIEVLNAPNLSSLKGIKHAFFTRQGGVSEGLYASLNAGLSSIDDQTKVAENRRRIALHLGAEPGNLVSCYQIHSADVVTVTEPWQAEDRPKADGFVTKVPGIALGILTADCGPLLFADTAAGVIGACHAGWRGAVGGVIENTLGAMEQLGADRARIKAALGPCIWQRNYEVGAEFPEPFLNENVNSAAFFVPADKPDHFMFDLPGYIASKMAQSGVTDFCPSLADTYADERRFFSYRRNCIQENAKRSASLLSVIMMEQGTEKDAK